MLQRPRSRELTGFRAIAVELMPRFLAAEDAPKTHLFVYGPSFCETQAYLHCVVCNHEHSDPDVDTFRERSFTRPYRKEMLNGLDNPDARRNLHWPGDRRGLARRVLIARRSCCQ